MVTIAITVVVILPHEDGGDEEVVDGTSSGVVNVIGSAD